MHSLFSIVITHISINKLPNEFESGKESENIFILNMID